MVIHIDIAENSDAESNALTAIELISPEQLLQNNQTSLIPLPDGVRYNQNLPRYINEFYANSHQIREFFPALVERLGAAARCIHQPLHEATLSPGGAKDALKACVVVLKQETRELARVREQQSRMQATQQSMYNGLDVELDCLNAWKKVSVILMALAAAISAALAVTAVNVNPKMIAVAAAATATTVLIGALGNGIHSFLKKRGSAVKKKRDIIRAMLMSAEIVINNLTQVYDLARDLQSQTASILEMVDDGATDVAVREKVLALINSFRKLQMKIMNCNSEVSFATEAVRQSINRNSEMVTLMF